MQSLEELRDTIVSLERRNQVLSIDNRQSQLLVNTVERLLADESGDPFSAVFPALEEAFGFSHAALLIEHGTDGNLVCDVARPAEMLGSSWTKDRFLQRVLDGRATALLPGEVGLSDLLSFSPLLSFDQPTLYVPLQINDERGVMILWRPSGSEGYGREHVRLARKFGLLASLALAAKSRLKSTLERDHLLLLTERLRASEALLSRKANYDHLTGLPNREFTHELVSRELEAAGAAGRIAVCFIDVDDFKKINDSFGHALGDEVLREMARRLTTFMAGKGVAGRISGDEFLAVFRKEDVGRVMILAQQLADLLCFPVPKASARLTTSATIGIAVNLAGRNTYETLQRAADLAMYRAKSVRRGSVCLFEETMGEEAEARFQLESDLKEALANDRLRCVFQPKCDLSNGRVLGFEALARWIDKDGSMRSPDTFIEAASEFNLLDRVTEAIVQDLVRHIPDLLCAFGSHLQFSVNISAKQIADENLVRSVIAQVERAGYADRMLLEVTEDAFVDAERLRTDVLPLLQACGIRLSIDDFGTGYSSLSTLTSIPASELKVDRAFVRNIDQNAPNQSVFQAIESLGRTLSLSVVAEGIETKAELDYLRDNSAVRVGQGYYFGKPALPDQLIANKNRSAVYLRSIGKDEQDRSKTEKVKLKKAG